MDYHDMFTARNRDIKLVLSKNATNAPFSFEVYNLQVIPARGVRVPCSYLLHMHKTLEELIKNPPHMTAHFNFENYEEFEDSINKIRRYSPIVRATLPKNKLHEKTLKKYTKKENISGFNVKYDIVPKKQTYGKISLLLKPSNDRKEFVNNIKKMFPTVTMGKQIMKAKTPKIDISIDNEDEILYLLPLRTDKNIKKIEIYIQKEYGE